MLGRIWRVATAARPNLFWWGVLVFCFALFGWKGIAGFVAFTVFMVAMNLIFVRETREEVFAEYRKRWRGETGTAEDRTGKTDDLLRSLSDDGPAMTEPLTDQEIEEALRQGREDAKAYRRKGGVVLPPRDKPRFKG